MGCNSCGKSGGNTKTHNNKKKSGNYYDRYGYLTPKQLEKKREQETKEASEEEENKG